MKDKHIDQDCLLEELAVCKIIEQCYGDAHYFPGPPVDGEVCVCGEKRTRLEPDGRAMVLDVYVWKGDN